MLLCNSRCSHVLDPVALPSGVIIHCSSLHNERSADSPAPDFGLYADFQWRPYWPNEFIHWLDFSAPTDKDTAIRQMLGLYERAKNSVVEIGCIGGHGRTGTILACLYTFDVKGLCGGQEAVDWVRSRYCEQAVESETQMTFIEEFSTWCREQHCNHSHTTKGN